MLPLQRQQTGTSTAPSQRQSKRFSVAAMYMSMGGVDKDDDIDDALAKAQKHLRFLKAAISEQSKHNFVLEKDVRYLDTRIALIIQNKMGVEEQKDIASRLDEHEAISETSFPDRKKTDLYSNLFFLLQSEPKHIASLCTLVSMTEIDSLLQTVMFTIYGNQYEQREEHLLLSMFQAVLAYQFDTTLEFSSLLRANTPVSRMMTTYTRRGPGQSYLRETLSHCLNDIISNPQTLEINPMRVLIETDSAPDMTMDQAAENPEVIAIIEPRLRTLEAICENVLSTIINSKSIVPYGIRWICKQIRGLARRKYPDAPDASVCSLIGAFFFLRFINPAIVSPQTYMLIDKLPNDANCRRTLTLVAKVLQNIANKPTTSKEPYMASLTPFLEVNKNRVNKFLNELCEVPDFYESLEMDQYIALSKKDLSISITLNEIYGMHGLLVKYISDTKDVHLQKVMGDLGTCPALVPRAQNATIDLSLFSQWEASVLNESHSDSGAYNGLSLLPDISRSDVVFMELKTILINIIRAFPPGHPILTRPLRLRSIADFAASSSVDDSGVIKRGIKALDLLDEMDKDEYADDDKFVLVSEIENELSQLGSLQDSVEQEAVSLETVYRVITEQNEYLRSQLDTYRSYLNNVRSHTGSKKDRKIVQDDTTTATTLNPLLNPAGSTSSYSEGLVKKYNVTQLMRDGVILTCSLPLNRVGPSLVFYIASPAPGTFVLALVMKGRSDPVVTVDFKIDDLLEIADQEVDEIDLQCLVLSVKNLQVLLKREFDRRR
ncbi:YALIA101S05e09428g1_1 [Yarrowia lipolytica]|nr:GTPase-activating protein [Yarrowia lipolytica]SEI34730.1 YALIA101S05e09428g1_1 [Yarrowia lipolytica]